MNDPTLLIRADASAEIGFGHVLRSLAIAQAWRDVGGEVIFVCAQLPEILKARLEGEKCIVFPNNALIGSLADAFQTQLLARINGVSWVVCDGYQFKGDFLSTLKCDKFSLVALDDFSDADMSGADIILNPNAGATALTYAGLSPQTALLAGQEFALLRREFRLLPRRQKECPANIQRVLIAMGGTDAGGLVPRVLQWLQEQNFEGEVVVLGGTRPVDFPAPPFHLRFVNAQNEVPEFMRWCDLAIAAAGATTWELACCGVPALLSVVAPNQRELARWCHENGVAVSIGEADETWESRLQEAWEKLQKGDARREMSGRAQRAIDGQGAARVVQKLWPEALQWRAARRGDAALLWEWRNEAQTRAMSLQNDFIDWESHQAWFEQRLDDEDSLIWLAERNGVSLGTVRFTRADGEATISVVVAPEWRGRGLGSALIKSACHALFGVWEVAKIRAIVKAENVTSRRAFEKAGFCGETEGSSMSQPLAHLNLLLERGA